MVKSIVITEGNNHYGLIYGLIYGLMYRKNLLLFGFSHLYEIRLSRLCLHTYTRSFHSLTILQYYLMIN